jgi:nitrous oxidase accessory protein
MEKRILIIGVLFLLLFSSVAPISIGQDVKILDKKKSSYRGNILYVGGSGPNNYTEIQDAIDNASDGDTIFVFDDSSPYYEKLSIDKPINLIGEDRDTTVIDGQNKGTVVNIQSDNVIVSGFKIINCMEYQDYRDVIYIKGYKNILINSNIISIGSIDIFGCRWSGIYLSSCSNVLIQNNIIFKDKEIIRTAGIEIKDGCQQINASGNEIYGYTEGIWLEESSHNMFYNNYCHHNTWGIDSYGSYDEIIGNEVKYNSYTGIEIASGGYSIVTGNTVSYNGDGYSEFCCGIMIFCTSNNIITNNIVTNNAHVGIWMLGGQFPLLCRNNIIIDNHIYNNEQMGIYLDTYIRRTTISRNNFIDNGKNAYFVVELLQCFSNKWDGNYWSDAISPAVSPKIIYGKSNFLFFFPISMINIDWHPAKEPYDIGLGL